MIKAKAYAKFNLNLHLLPKMINGFYPVRFLNCQLNLADEVIFKNQANQIEVICEHPKVPQDKKNLIYKAARLLKREVNRPKLGAKIILKKHVPVKAGLGGGSSDAAAALNFLPRLWNLTIPRSKLIPLASSLGKDVVYSLIGGLAKISGTGERVAPLSIKMPQFPLVLVVPKETKPSTAWSYRHLEEKTLGKNLNKLSKCVKAISTQDINLLTLSLHNDFEASIVKHYPIVAQIKTELKQLGALRTLLCGSGLTVVGFFKSRSLALEAQKRLSNKYQLVILTTTL